MRNASRAFETLRERFSSLRSSGIPFGFLFTLTHDNIGDLHGWRNSPLRNTRSCCKSILWKKPAARARRCMVRHPLTWTQRLDGFLLID
jgi:hypothetical protein